MYVGNSLNSGIEIGQSNNGALLRSIGYEGWTRATTYNKPGFMIWSGSVAPGGYNDYDYAGVGIEITDGLYSSFRFVTQKDPNENLMKLRDEQLAKNRQQTQNYQKMSEEFRLKYDLKLPNNNWLYTPTKEKSNYKKHDDDCKCADSSRKSVKSHIYF
jgi:hypothetical protein